ncbi:Hypothetical protein CAP_6124 [Chondromyces apiculatus DSM 436]|uniref:Uncharacterized protein n=1 Tax=Chondromyces apiculatus DSM 436 TaxID=1192034 RepID=A0A017T1Q6_9BACT|nr:Hypothetical protein CAP_6124 [Chondromyces apiculatus DSM 436]
MGVLDEGAGRAEARHGGRVYTKSCIDTRSPAALLAVAQARGCSGRLQASDMQ